MQRTRNYDGGFYYEKDDTHEPPMLRMNNECSRLSTLSNPNGTVFILWFEGSTLAQQRENQCATEKKEKDKEMREQKVYIPSLYVF